MRPSVERGTPPARALLVTLSVVGWALAVSIPLTWLIVLAVERLR